MMQMIWRLLVVGLFLAFPAVAADAQGAQPAIILAQADVSASDFLSDRRQPPALSNEELKMRLANGRRLLQSTSISASDRALVEAAVKSATLEMDRRATASKPAMTEQKDAATPPDQTAGKDQTKPGGKRAGTLSLEELLADDRTPDELGKKELRKRIRSARALIKDGDLSRPDRRKVRVLLRAARQEVRKRRGKATGGTKDTQPDDGGTTNPPAEEKTNPQ
jgi:hypothetical protein